MTTEGNFQIQSNPYQITNSIFTELEWKVSQFVWRHKRLQMAKYKLEKEKEILPESVRWLQTIVLYLFSHYVLSDLFATLWTVPARILYPWDFPSKNTGVSCHFLLHGIFSTNDRTHVSCIGKQILYHTEPPGKPSYIVQSYKWKHYVTVTKTEV